MSTIWCFDHIEDKQTLYRRKDCMKKFCTSLRENAENIIDLERKKILPLTKEELKPHQEEKVCYTCGKRIENYGKIRDLCHYRWKYRGAAYSIFNSKLIVLNKIPVVCLNGLNYDHHFVIKKLANEFEGQIESLGENNE